MVNAISLQELADAIGCQIFGDANLQVHGLATLQKAGEGEVTFLTNPLYVNYLSHTQASAIIVDAKTHQEFEHQYHGAWLVARDPYVSFARATQFFQPEVNSQASIHPSVVIGRHCAIDESAVIHAGCVIGDNVTIGPRTLLWPNVSVYSNTQIGADVIVHSGAVLGSDGFGFANDKGVWVKIIQLGGLIISDNVEIGANTTIDRGALDDTIIEQGVKIDNQVQIGHNVRIGEHTIIAGCVGIAGSTSIGRYCMIGGASGIAGHLTIADRVILTGMSMVTGSITKAGTYSSGTGLDEHQVWRRNAATFRRLHKMQKQLNAHSLKNELEGS